MATGLERVERSMDAMGTTYMIVLYGDDRNSLETAVQDAFSEIHRIEELLSHYRPMSEWSRVNREAAHCPVQVSAELLALLERALAYSRLSAGAFDLTVGPLLKAWGFYRGDGRLPAREEIEAALRVVGYEYLHLDATARTVRFDRPGVELDPGGIGKGYAVERVAELLRERGVKSALIAGSASSIYGLGAPPADPRGWPVRIKDPQHPRAALAEIHLKDQAVSTSGRDEKVFWEAGRAYSHILDPRTGYPPPNAPSLVSVVAPSATESEAWTKPAFINGRRWTEEHKPEDFRVLFRADGDEGPGVWF